MERDRGSGEVGKFHAITMKMMVWQFVSVTFEDYDGDGDGL